MTHTPLTPDEPLHPPVADGEAAPTPDAPRTGSTSASGLPLGEPAAAEPPTSANTDAALSEGAPIEAAPSAVAPVEGVPGSAAPSAGPDVGTGADPLADETDPLSADERTEELRPCPGCGALTGAGSFCEACGSEVGGAHSAPAQAGTAAMPAMPETSASSPADAPLAGAPVGESRDGGMLVLGAPIEPASAPTPAPEAEGPRCECGGGYLDGYCEQCGSPKPDPRDHIEIDGAAWVAGVTDVGIRHRINQDAMALQVDGDRAALVVCDGVSTALRSEDASQAAADAAVGVLARATSTGVGVPSSVVPAISSRLAAAADAAADAVADITDAVHAELTAQGANLAAHTNPSCTFVAAAVEAGHVVVGSVGDSRAYWFPDGEPAHLLTTDDSVAEERIALGTPRAEAETGPGAHTITRWLGIDSPDHAPRPNSLDVDRPGWLIVCSDGLWNYASEADALAAVVADVAASVGDQPEAAQPGADGLSGETGRPSVSPLLLARGLVTWANAMGGHDNITVIAARLHDDRKAPTDG